MEKKKIRPGMTLYRACLSYCGKRNIVNEETVIDMFQNGGKWYITTRDTIGQTWTTLLDDVDEKTLFCSRENAEVVLGIAQTVPHCPCCGSTAGFESAVKVIQYYKPDGREDGFELATGKENNKVKCRSCGMPFTLSKIKKEAEKYEATAFE